MLNSSYQITEVKRLEDLFFHPGYLTVEKMDDIFRGLSHNLMKEKSGKIISSLRNLLTLDHMNRELKTDLLSLNIQRARDHGLCTYN